MRVAVIGGAGVLGSWATAAVAATGAEPVVLDLRDDRSILDIAAPSVPFELVDIRSGTELVAKLRSIRPDGVVHAAALMPEACEQDPVGAIEINLTGAVNVVRAAAECGIGRIVFFSSRASLGELGQPYVGPTYEPVPESLGLNPESVYGAVKAAAERICTRMAKAHGINFASLRFASTYGVGKVARHGELAVISQIVEGAAAGREIHIPSGGDQPNDFIYCRDVGRAAAMAVTHGEPVNGVFHIGSGGLATLKQVAGVVKRRLPNADLVIGPGFDYRGRGPALYVQMSIEKAQESFGFRPAYDIVSGIDDYLNLVISRNSARPGSDAEDRTA